MDGDRSIAELEIAPAEHAEIRYSKGEALLLAEGKLRSASKEELESDAMIAAQNGSGCYKSCPWIEGSAFIANGSVKLCCYASMGGRGSTELFRSNTLLDLDKIPSGEVIAAKKTVRLANQTTDSLCAGCYDLREAEWQARDHFHVIATAGTLHCNLSCSYCVTYDFSKDRGSPLAPLFENYIKDGSFRPGGYIDFGGGESTLHRDFGAVANLAFDHGMYMNVFTNATAFSREVGVGLEKELASVICSVDAGTAPTYKRIKGKDFLEKVWATLARYAVVNRMRVFAKYIVMDANCSAEEIDEFINRAVAANIRNIVAATNVYNNSGNDGTLPPHIVNAIAYLVVQAKKNDLTVTYSDVYSPHALNAIAQASEDSRILESVRSSLTNRVGSLEIAFVEAEIFLLRILTMLATEDDFRVVLPNPLDRGSAMPAMLGVIAQPAFANSNYSTTREPEGPFLSSLSEAALHGPGDWSDRLRDMEAYAVELRLDPSGTKLAALEFTRRGDPARLRREARANLGPPAASAAPTLPGSGGNGLEQDLEPVSTSLAPPDAALAPMAEPSRNAPDLLELVPGGVLGDRDQDDEQLRVTLSPTLLSETNAPIAVIANLILQSSPDSWFRVVLNDVEMLLPRNTILTMRHCIRPGTEGPISLYVEEHHLPWILSHLSDAEVFLDVGAATGAMTLPVALTNPGLLVVAFEPARRARELLVGTLRKNAIQTVEVVASAVSDLAGHAVFSEYQLAVPGEPPYLPEASAIHHDLINSSLVESQYDVDVTSLDKFCAERGLMTTPSVIKIDVEGFETRVLEGARRYIASARPWLAIDIHRDPFGNGETTELPVRAILDQFGYEFENMRHVLLCKPLSSGVTIRKSQSPEPVGGAPCLLDLVPGAVAAFGLRRLRADFGRNDPGGIIRLRRDGNGDGVHLGTLADGQLDLSAASRLPDGADAECATWYDQSGNGNHAEAIATGPAFDPSPGGGSPTFRFRPPAQLRSPVTLEGLAEFSIFAVFRAASPAEATSVARWQKDGDFVVFPYSSGDVIVGHHGGPIDRVPLGITPGKFEVYGAVWKQGAADGFTTYRNGAMVMRRAAGTAAIAVGNDPLYIGSYAGLCEHFTGDLVELVIWPRALSDDEVRVVSQNIYDARGLPGAASVAVLAELDRPQLDEAESTRSTPDVSNGGTPVIDVPPGLDAQPEVDYLTAGPSAPRAEIAILPGSVYAKYALPIEYLPSRDLQPRWGYTHPPIGVLNDWFSAHAPRYEAFLQEMECSMPELASIPRHFTEQRLPDPTWFGVALCPFDSLALYTMVRLLKPQTYLEIGSGISTCFAAKAVRDHNLQTRIIAMDPEPKATIDAICDEVIREGLETCNLDRFDMLQPGDIVFFDGSHRSFMNSDVTVFMIDVLPRLKPGVVIHIHDVTLPWDYHHMFVDWYWNEQYLVAVYLMAARDRLDPILPTTFICQDVHFADLLENRFIDFGDDYLNSGWRGGGSMWFTHKGEVQVRSS